jgi:hypothetical protein
VGRTYICGLGVLDAVLSVRKAGVSVIMVFISHKYIMYLELHPCAPEFHIHMSGDWGPPTDGRGHSTEGTLHAFGILRALTITQASLLNP